MNVDCNIIISYLSGNNNIFANCMVIKNSYWSSPLDAFFVSKSLVFSNQNFDLFGYADSKIGRDMFIWKNCEGRKNSSYKRLGLVNKYYDYRKNKHVMFYSN